MRVEKHIWICSDTHLSHGNIIKYGRPENFEELIKKSLNNVEDDDILIHLGDICVGKDVDNNQFFANIKGKHILVRGNHDGKTPSFYLRYWDFVCEEVVMKYHGKIILFSHKPKAKRDGIDFNIHGHLHEPGRFNRRVSLEKELRDEFDFDYDDKYHKLISMEELNYNLISLDKII
jgi:calcineurin-like phosphoesterase family protein